MRSKDTGKNCHGISITRKRGREIRVVEVLGWVSGDLQHKPGGWLAAHQWHGRLLPHGPLGRSLHGGRFPPNFLRWWPVLVHDGLPQREVGRFQIFRHLDVRDFERPRHLVVALLPAIFRQHSLHLQHRQSEQVAERVFVFHPVEAAHRGDWLGLFRDDQFASHREQEGLPLGGRGLRGVGGGHFGALHPVEGANECGERIGIGEFAFKLVEPQALFLNIGPMAADAVGREEFRVFGSAGNGGEQQHRQHQRHRQDGGQMGKATRCGRHGGRTLGLPLSMPQNGRCETFWLDFQGPAGGRDGAWRGAG